MDGYCSITVANHGLYTVANHGLSRLIRFVPRFTAHPCEKFCKNILHLVLHACVQTFSAKILDPNTPLVYSQVSSALPCLFACFYLMRYSRLMTMHFLLGGSSIIMIFEINFLASSNNKFSCWLCLEGRQLDPKTPSKNGYRLFVLVSDGLRHRVHLEKPR